MSSFIVEVQYDYDNFLIVCLFDYQFCYSDVYTVEPLLEQVVSNRWVLFGYLAFSTPVYNKPSLIQLQLFWMSDNLDQNMKNETFCLQLVNYIA
jgi:hypothetical protein